MGLMEQVGFIAKLARCGGSEDPKIEEIESKLKMPETKNSIYIMLGCILRGHSSDDSKTDKYCQATFDTLELCQALSSKKNAVEEKFVFKDNKINVNDAFNLEFNPSNLTAKLPGGGDKGGGGIKTRKNKKPRKQNKIKTRKNQY